MTNDELTRVIKELKGIDAEWRALAAVEKAVGKNDVKAALYLGTSAGVRIALNVLNQGKHETRDG